MIPLLVVNTFQGLNSSHSCRGKAQYSGGTLRRAGYSPEEQQEVCDGNVEHGAGKSKRGEKITAEIAENAERLRGNGKSKRREKHLTAENAEIAEGFKGVGGAAKKHLTTEITEGHRES